MVEESKWSGASEPVVLRIGHSPDADDAFMWYALGGGGRRALIETGPYRFEHVLEDIESLNRRTERGELEITALSVHQYAFVAERYALTSCGGSVGMDYGPIVVAEAGRGGGRGWEWLREAGVKIAVPGRRTTAFLVLSLLLGRGDFAYEEVPFDQILGAVAEGRFAAGLIIHEGQLTYKQYGLEEVVDLGKWWRKTRGLPLPLGGNAIRRDLGWERMIEICGILKRAIRYALEHRAEALEYAMQFGRGLERERADRFVRMYVNHWTLDWGPVGRRAIERLLKEGAQAGLVPGLPRLDLVPAGRRSERGSKG